MNVRHKLAEGLALVFFMPVAVPVMLLTQTPHPQWLHTYSKLFVWISGSK